MFAEPAPTRLDLRFHLFGTPIRIHPMFWAVSAVLGLRLPAVELLVWVAVVFASIVVHEMGHALAFALFRCRSRVVVYSLGGLTIPESTAGTGALRGWRSALVSASGPLAGFCLAGMTFVLLPLVVATSSGLSGALYYHLIWINLVWGAFNLLPVWPLDGGQVARSLLTAFAGDSGYAAATVLSLVTSGIGVVVTWQMGLPLAALFFAYFALAEWQRSF
jgi:Zn-dependent protease